jgi:hypothetical protein
MGSKECQAKATFSSARLGYGETAQVDEQAAEERH